MIGRVSYAVREDEYVVDLDGDNGWTFATAAEAEHFAEVCRAAVRYHAEVEREECALVCEAEARRLAAMVAYGNHVAGIAAEKVGNVARAIRSRGGSR